MASLTLIAPLIVVHLLIVMPANTWIVSQPKKNVWVTLAHALKQQEMCMSTVAVDSPLSTSLVGVPLEAVDYPQSLRDLLREINSKKSSFHAYIHNRITYKIKLPIINPLILWRKWTEKLQRLAEEPTEIELLGSLKAPCCVQFDFTPSSRYHDPEIYQHIKQTKFELTAAQWCRDLAKVALPFSRDEHYPNPLALPKGIFLICGDHAWQGIPSHLIGGPCTLGRLTLATPNMTQIPIWRH